MAQSLPHRSESSARDRLEQVVAEFEQAWHESPCPELEAFLPADPQERTTSLVELVHVDLEFRWRAGETVRIESYLGRYPEISRDRETVAALLAREFRLRRRREPHLGLEDYRKRFPEYLAELNDLAMAEGLALSTRNEPSGMPDPAATRTYEASPEMPDPWVTRNYEAPHPKKTQENHPVIDGYQLLGTLGKGGMGVVYKARHLALKRVVALKMILAGAHSDAEEMARFRLEAEAVARFQHPGIVQIFEIGEQDGLPFCALEYVEGGTLAQKLRAGPLLAAEAAALAESLAQAMDYAHQRHIVHRDLKPGNVLLTPDGKPKVTDFGLAKHLDVDSGHTQTGQIMGTPSFMAPEQAAGRIADIGPAADVYALGAILYDMLIGKPPFHGANIQETLEQVRSADPVPPSRLRPGLPRDLETICLKCLAKEPVRRFATARALAEDLGRFLAGEPILSRRQGPVEKVIRWGRRKPYQALLAAASVLLGIAVVFAVAIYGLYQGQQAKIAQEKLDRLEQSEQDRKAIEQQWFAARLSMGDRNWAEAKTQLAAALQALEVQHDIEEVDELGTKIKQNLDVVNEHLKTDAEHTAALSRSHDIRKPYDDAWFHETLSTGLNPKENRAGTLASAHAGLAVYRLDRQLGENDELAELLKRDQTHLAKADHAKVVGDCYELLLIWAEAEAGVLPEEIVSPQEVRDRAVRGLAVLARAEKLAQAFPSQAGLDTQTFHRRQARYLALSRGEQFDPARVTGGPPQPTGVIDWFLLAMDSYRADRIEQAGFACGQVLELQEKHFWARYLSGLCHLRASRWPQAHEDLSICLSEKKHVWPLLLRGFAASELGNERRQGIDKAGLDMVSTLVSVPLHPGSTLPSLAAAGRLATRSWPGAYEFAGARHDFDEALSAADLDKQAKYVALANRGTLLIRQGQWDQAIADLTRASELNPDAYQGHFNLAQALERAGRATEALAAMDQAIACEGGMDVLYASRAAVYLEKKDSAAAEADLEEAVAQSTLTGRSERLAWNLLQLGRLLQARDKNKVALERFERALVVKPDLFLAERFRAEALLSLDRSMEAGQAFDRYLQLNPQPAPEVLLARGLIHARAGQLPQAIEMYSAKLRLTPRDCVTRHQRGWAYLQTDSLPLALRDFEACVQEKPDSAEFLVGRGVARVRMKKFADAVADAEKAEQLGPLSDRLLYNLASLYAQAAVQAEAEAKKRSERSPSRWFAFYADKAVDSLTRSLQLLDEEKRAPFWKNQVRIDPLLTPIRPERNYKLLEARYAQGRNL